MVFDARVVVAARVFAFRRPAAVLFLVAIVVTWKVVLGHRFSASGSVVRCNDREKATV